MTAFSAVPSWLLMPGTAETIGNMGKDVQDFYRPIFDMPALQADTNSGKVMGFVGGIAGAMGKAVLSGPAAPLLFGAEAFGSKSGRALDTGANASQALLEGSGSGALNTLLGFLPGGAQNQGLVRSGLTRAARGVGLGLGVTAGENALSRIHQQGTALMQGWQDNVMLRIESHLLI